MSNGTNTSAPTLKQYRKFFKKGDILMKEGEIGQDLLFLEKGIIDIFVKGKKINTIDASSSQDFFGEIGAVLGTPRTATLVAAADCVALYMPKIELESVLKSSPSLGSRLIKSLSKKLVNSLSNFAEVKSDNTSVLSSGSTDASLRNYMKGLLYLIELSAEDKSGKASKNLMHYFLHTNPWGIQHGNWEHLLDYSYPHVISSSDSLNFK